MTGLKKNLTKLSSDEKKCLIDEKDSRLSIRQQCEILGANRSNVYYNAHPREYHSLEFRENVMARIDYYNTSEPAWGVNKLETLIKNEGLHASRELIRNLMHEMGIMTIYPHFNTSKADKNARKMPYLLKEMRKNNMIWLPNLVWATDITYIKMGKSHMYLIAIIDWFSRFIVGWTLSDTLDTAPTIYALQKAFMQYGVPSIINSDQGSQYTSDEYMRFLSAHNIRQSMDGKARWVDNVIIERWFRNLKCERIYIWDYQNPKDLRAGISEYIYKYNTLRPHQSHGNQTPETVYSKAFTSNSNPLTINSQSIKKTSALIIAPKFVHHAG